MIIRHARRDEYGAIAALIEEAFRDSAVSLGHEVQFVEILRSSDAYIPGLEYVAADDDSGEILGHIILSVLPISHGNSSIRGFSSRRSRCAPPSSTRASARRLWSDPSLTR